MDSTRGIGRTLTLAMMWLGIALCVVILSGWLASAWWSGGLAVRSFPASGQRSVGVYVLEGGVSVRELVNPGDISWTLLPDGWSFRRARDAPRLRYWFNFRDASFGLIKGWELFVPLWAPLLLCGMFTVLAWRRVRNRPGYCPCGYSLAGLAMSGVCPECGRGRKP